jgi:hypothetical protein
MNKLFVVALGERDFPLLEPLREAVNDALKIRPELAESTVMIQRHPENCPSATTVRGPRADGVRVLMNVVYDVTSHPVIGDLVSG